MHLTNPLHLPVRVCFVCSGNICRSPTAEVALLHAAQTTGRADLVVVDSAGTGAWHAGGDMDPRSRQTLERAGYVAGRHEARQFGATDFAERDVVVALDSGHRDALLDLAEVADDPVAARASVVLLRQFDPELGADEPADVADPYYGGPTGFTDVLAQIERSCVELLGAISRALDQQARSAQQAASERL